MQSSQPLIRCHNISKTYIDGSDSIKVLDNVNFQVASGETLAILGSSGSGKSTLLHILGTLDKPDDGQLFYEQTDLLSLKDAQQAKFRNTHLGFVYQFHHLLPEFTALENVAMPLLIGKKDKATAFNKAKEKLNEVGLSHRLEHKPWQLSGGERQRIAIARAIINEPSVVMADEPTGNLDNKNSQIIVDLILQLNKAYGTTFVIVTHDMQLSEQMASAMHLRNGAFTEGQSR
ncbi:MAG: lipoprotein-releasing ABC transporter ATP-binding protein LolD [Pseudomonadota bacterium]